MIAISQRKLLLFIKIWLQDNRLKNIHILTIFMLTIIFISIALILGPKFAEYAIYLIILMISVINIYEIQLIQKENRPSIQLASLIELQPKLLYVVTITAVFYYLILYFVTNILKTEITFIPHSSLLYITLFVVWYPAFVSSDLLIREVLYWQMGIDSLEKARIMLEALKQKINIHKNSIETNAPFPKSYVKYFRNSLKYLNKYLIRILPEKMVIKDIDSYYIAIAFNIATENENRIREMEQSIEQFLYYLRTNKIGNNLERILEILARTRGRTLGIDKKYELYDMLKIVNINDKLRNIRYDYILSLLNLILMVYQIFFK